MHLVGVEIPSVKSPIFSNFQVIESGTLHTPLIVFLKCRGMFWFDSLTCDTSAMKLIILQCGFSL